MIIPLALLLLSSTSSLARDVWSLEDGGGGTHMARRLKRSSLSDPHSHPLLHYDHVARAGLVPDLTDGLGQTVGDLTGSSNSNGQNSATTGNTNGVNNGGTGTIGDGTTTGSNSNSNGSNNNGSNGGSNQNGIGDGLGGLIGDGNSSSDGGNGGGNAATQTNQNSAPGGGATPTPSDSNSGGAANGGAPTGNSNSNSNSNTNSGTTTTSSSSKAGKTSSSQAVVTITTSSSSSTNSATGAPAGNNNGGGMGKTTIIAIGVIGGVVVGAGLLWTIIRKTTFKTSKRFNEKLNPIEFGPDEVPFPAPAGLHRSDSIGSSVPGRDEKSDWGARGGGSEWGGSQRGPFAAHARNGSGGTEYSSSGMGQRGAAAYPQMQQQQQGYGGMYGQGAYMAAPGMAASQSGGRSLVGMDGLPQAGYPYPPQQPTLNNPYDAYGGLQANQSVRRAPSPNPDPYYRGGY